MHSSAQGLLLAQLLHFGERMANATDHVEDAGDAAGLDRLLSWFKSHGGRISKLCLEDLGGDMSLSVVTEEPVLKGDVVMSIPISVCMTVESVSGDAGTASSSNVNRLSFAWTQGTALRSTLLVAACCDDNPFISLLLHHRYS